MFQSLAVLLNERGNRLSNNGKNPAAKRWFKWATRFSPSWSAPWYNLGLISKYACDWNDSFRYNLRAVQLNRADDAGWWNLGIAATALRNWQEAATAWRALKINIDLSSGEVRMPTQWGCVRLDPDLQGEVVWGERLDPARFAIKSIPLPESGHRYGDVVLNDGAVEGTRTSNARQYSVFNELQMFEKSRYSTFEAEVTVPNESAERGLVDLFHANGLGIEDFSTIRWICSECSRGNPGPHECASHPSDGSRRIGFAAVVAQDVDRLLNEWRRANAGADFGEIVITLEA
ncbi:MAG TPA: hypothetical protein VFU86_13920 [Terriglobales bacterium]|nr:hypothetical protein [Terriglobales bacterium]